MKFIKKALKKVFKPIKKFAKSDLGKIALIAGGTFFTAGLGTVGFGAFAGATGPGGILGAVGKTIAAGAQGMLGAIGIGRGLSANLASGIEGAEAGQTLFGMSLFGGAGGQTPGINPDAPRSNMPGFIKDSAPVVPEQGNIMSGLNKLFGDNTGLVLARGIMGGVQMYAQGEQWKEQQKMINRRQWFGGDARGGGTGGAPQIGFSGRGVLDGVTDFRSDEREDPLQTDTVTDNQAPQVNTDPLGNASPRSGMFNI